MNDRKKESGLQLPVMIGGSSLLVIFAVLSLTVFALLSLNTVLADKRLVDASAEAVTAYYEADCRAEEIFAQLRSAAEQEETKSGTSPELPQGVICEGDIYQYTCPISDTQTLYVTLKKDGQNWIILRWQAVARAVLQETQPKLWDAGTTS